jgi:hypothetical protein
MNAPTTKALTLASLIDTSMMESGWSSLCALYLALTRSWRHSDRRQLDVAWVVNTVR